MSHEGPVPSSAQGPEPLPGPSSAQGPEPLPGPSSAQGPEPLPGGDGDWTVREGDGPETIERKLGHRERARLERAARRHELGRPEVTELEIGSTTHRVAEVEPMDVDGVRTMTVGTIVWGVVAVALLPFLGTLEERGQTWWMWTALAGLGLGLIGIEYCRRRRNALRMQPGRRKKV